MESSIPQVFLTQHVHVHAATTPGAPSRQDSILAGLTDAQLRQCLEHHNSIVWLLWHIARVEDLTINTGVRGVPEVIDRGNWQARLGVTRRDIGTGMSAEEVAQFSAQVDVAAVRAYRAAVAQETRSGLTARDFDDLDKPVAGAGQRALASGHLGPGAEYVAELMTTRPRWFLLCVEAIGHSYEHLGEADHVARLLRSHRALTRMPRWPAAARYTSEAPSRCPPPAPPRGGRGDQILLCISYAHAPRLAEWPRDLARLCEAGYTVLALTPRAEAVDISALGTSRPRPARLAVLLGTQGRGLSAAALAAADLQVRIPMTPEMDSLNVATAGAVALHWLSRTA